MGFLFSTAANRTWGEFPFFSRLFTFSLSTKIYNFRERNRNVAGLHIEM